MIDWSDFWKQYLPPQVEQPWTPTYEPQQYTMWPGNDGTVERRPIELFMFATQETAEHLKEKYDPRGFISSMPMLGAGPDSQTADMRVLVWPNGVTIVAGMLANLWSLNAAHPDVANRLTLDAIAARGAA